MSLIRYDHLTNHIPKDNLFTVLEFLRPREAKQLREASRKMKAAASDERLWKIYCSRQLMDRWYSSSISPELREMQTNHFFRYHLRNLEKPIDVAIEEYGHFVLQGIGFYISRIPSIEGARHSNPLTGIAAEGLLSALMVYPPSMNAANETAQRWTAPIAFGFGVANAMIVRYFDIKPDFDAAFPPIASLAASYIFTKGLLRIPKIPENVVRQCALVIALYPLNLSLTAGVATLLALTLANAIPRKYQGPFATLLGVGFGYFQPRFLLSAMTFFNGLSIIEAARGRSEGFAFSYVIYSAAYPGWNIFAGLLPFARSLLLEMVSSDHETRKFVANGVKRLLLSPLAIDISWNLWRGGVQLRTRAIRAVRVDIPNAIVRAVRVDIPNAIVRAVRVDIPNAISAEIRGNIRLFRNIASFLR